MYFYLWEGVCKPLLFQEFILLNADTVDICCFHSPCTYQRTACIVLLVYLVSIFGGKINSLSIALCDTRQWSAYDRQVTWKIVSHFLVFSFTIISLVALLFIHSVSLLLHSEASTGSFLCIYQAITVHLFFAAYWYSFSLFGIDSKYLLKINCKVDFFLKLGIENETKIEYCAEDFGNLSENSKILALKFKICETSLLSRSSK